MPSILLHDVETMQESGFDPAIIDAAREHDAMIERFLSSPIGPHLKSIEDAEVTAASGGRLLGAPAIKDEIEAAAPSAILFPFGYLPIWTSIGGSAVAFEINEQAFFWADRDAWIPDDSITIPETYEELPFTAENVPKALIELSSDDPRRFVEDLKTGHYEKRLEQLD